MKSLIFLSFLLSLDCAYTQESDELSQLKKVMSLLQSQMNALRKREGVSKIGEIRYSILKPSDFKAKYGPGWVLMNGQCFSKACCENPDNVAKGECPEDSPVKSKDSRLWKEVLKIDNSDYDDRMKNGLLPDTRGKFLRTSNNGLTGDTSDPDTTRKIGNFQEDAFQGHQHNLRSHWGNGSSGHQNPNAQGYGVKHYGDGIFTIGIQPHGNDGNPRTTKETRPKNIAVNTYIKIN